MDGEINLKPQKNGISSDQISVPAAGIIRDRPSLEHTDAGFRDSIDVNVDTADVKTSPCINSATGSLESCTTLRSH